MKLKPYPKYKESGVQWIGEVPEGWMLLKIKYIGNLQNGNGFSEELQGQETGEIPFLKVSDINNPGTIYLNTSINYVSTKQVIENRWNIIPVKSILFAKIGEAINKNHRKINQLKVIIDNNMSAFIHYKKFNYKYVYYIFKEMDMNDFLNVSAVPSLNMDLLKSYKFSITLNIEDQQKIATYLDTKTSQISKTIEADKRLIELLKEKRTALINHVVTKGLNPKAKMKDSGIEWIGEVPEGWKIVPLLKFLESKIDYRGATPEKVLDGVFLITARNVKGGKIDYEISQEFVLVDQYREIMHRGKPRIGDLLFTTEAPLGEVANIDKENVALAQRIIKMRGLSNKLDNYYLKYFIMSFSFQNHLQSYATGSTALGIKASNMCFLRLLLPSKPEQIEIYEYLNKETSKIDQTIKKIEEKIELLEEYKKSLIHHVVTGKVMVTI